MAVPSTVFWTPAHADSQSIAAFVTTGLHAVHLLGGLGAVAWLLGPGRRLRHRLPITVLYWHFVDVIWIVIFVLFYLL